MITKEEIEQLYFTENKSVVEITRIKGFSKRTFYNYLHKYGLERKTDKVTQKVMSVIGQTFGKWLVLEYAGGHRYLLCRCTCGKEQKVRYYDLIYGSTKGCNSCSGDLKSLKCGKYEHKKGKENWKFNGCEKLSGQKWASIRNNARVRNLEFTISVEYAYQVLELQEFKCNISGIEIKLPDYRSDECTASIDRIDSGKGYIENNVQWVHKDINMMKWNLDQDEFLEYCQIIVNNQKEKQNNAR